MFFLCLDIHQRVKGIFRCIEQLNPIQALSELKRALARYKYALARDIYLCTCQTQMVHLAEIIWLFSDQTSNLEFFNMYPGEGLKWNKFMSVMI